MTVHKEALIAQRAYEIWEEAGRPHGLDRDHWHQASLEIEQVVTVVMNGDAPVHASPNSVVSGDAPVHGPTPAAAKPRQAATTAPARTKSVAKAPVAAAKKMPAKPKKA
jgi:hypothetical protein